MTNSISLRDLLTYKSGGQRKTGFCSWSHRRGLRRLSALFLANGTC